ncbi:MAG TPA: site-specific integrase [Desulfobacterales bacterium]|nr:site-specific integrase [Desulfobacterales bacterium]
MASTGVQRRKLSKGYKWRYHLFHKGRKIFSPSIYDTEGDALKARQDKLIELASVGSNDTSLFHLIDQRLKDLRLDKSDRYVDDTEYYLDICKVAWGDIEIQKISKGMVKSLLNKQAQECARKGCQNYPVNYLLRILKAFMQYCIDYHDFEIRNPCKGIKPFSIEHREKYIPSDYEIGFVRSLLNETQQALLDVVGDTGARISEILRLRVEDIDFERNQLTLWTNKSRNSNRTYRKIRLPECLIEMDLPNSGEIFPQYNTHPKFIEKAIRDYNKQQDEIYEKQGEDNPKPPLRAWSWHNLRHKWTSEKAVAGYDILKIMYHLGHTNYQTTQGYINMLLGESQHDGNNVGDMWAESSKNLINSSAEWADDF